MKKKSWKKVAENGFAFNPIKFNTHERQTETRVNDHLKTQSQAINTEMRTTFKKEIYFSAFIIRIQKPFWDEI